MTSEPAGSNGCPETENSCSPFLTYGRKEEQLLSVRKRSVTRVQKSLKDFMRGKCRLPGDPFPRKQDILGTIQNGPVLKTARGEKGIRAEKLTRKNSG